MCIVSSTKFQLKDSVNVLRRDSSSMTGVVMTPVKNQRQYVGIGTILLQFCTKCNVQCVVSDGIFQVQGHSSSDALSCVQCHRDGTVFVSVVNVGRTLLHVRIQFCTRCPVCFCQCPPHARFSKQTFGNRVNGHVLNTVSWVFGPCGVSV